MVQEKRFGVDSRLLHELKIIQLKRRKRSMFQQLACVSFNNVGENELMVTATHKRLTIDVTQNYRPPVQDIDIIDDTTVEIVISVGLFIRIRFRSAASLAAFRRALGDLAENDSSSSSTTEESNDPKHQFHQQTKFKSDEDLPPADTIHWADGLLFVYSMTDRRSFTYLKRVGALIADSDIPVYIVVNKNDMVHLREISAEEGAMLARDFECGFSEVAAAEQVAPVAVVFQEICRAVRKSKHSLLERMLGTRTSSNLRLYVRGKSDSALPKD